MKCQTFNLINQINRLQSVGKSAEIYFHPSKTIVQGLALPLDPKQAVMQFMRTLSMVPLWCAGWTVAVSPGEVSLPQGLFAQGVYTLRDLPCVI